MITENDEVPVNSVGALGRWKINVLNSKNTKRVKSRINIGLSKTLRMSIKCRNKVEQLFLVRLIIRNFGFRTEDCGMK